MVAFGFSVGSPVYGIFFPTGASCGAEVVTVSEEGADVVVAGALVAAGACVGAEVAGGDGSSLPAGAHGTDVAVGAVVLVGVVVAAVVVVVVDVTGSHESACAGEVFSGELPGWAMLAATGVVTRNSAVVEIARARVIDLLRRVKCGAAFKAICYPSSSAWQFGAALIAPLWD
ncbi:hypothetical protein [Rhodococcus qingshengii]|uniref:hypothetical protein n=1 Tax=Rhodococcus qingshengii TaxID=334542 RepID=UPI0035F977F5